MRIVLTFVFLAITPAVFGQSARDMAARSDIQGGLVVYAGLSDGSVMTEFFANDSFIVQGLCRDRRDTAEAREHIHGLGLYGKASVQYWNRNYLPYTDNLVNLFVAEDLADVPMEEVIRVLAPRGVAWVKSGETWKKTTKPYPAEIDQWTHYLHGPDNNAVARDSRVGLPKHVQWIGYPKYARSHEQLASVSAMVSARGRLFCIIDEGLTADVRMPPKWRLVARDAFNGVILWKRKIDAWADHLHSFRSGPSDLPFRLVAVGDRVYVTLGLGQPVTALDAATGQLVMTYQGTENTRQIVHTGDRLILLTGSSQVTLRMRRGEDSSPRRVVMAANPETGEMIWHNEVSTETLLPLVVSNDALLYKTSDHLVCLSAKSGEERWRKARVTHLAAPGSPMWRWATPTLTAHNGIVYVADFRTLTASSIEDGKLLWECSSTSGFNSPPDIFVINDLLWRGYTRNRGSADFGEGLNARTGEVEKAIATQKAWSYPTLAQHRCYRPKATSQYILSSLPMIGRLCDMTALGAVESQAECQANWVSRGRQRSAVASQVLLLVAGESSSQRSMPTRYTRWTWPTAPRSGHLRPEGVSIPLPPFTNIWFCSARPTAGSTASAKRMASWSGVFAARRRTV